MEHPIRILNDDDRQTLAWLRTHVGDARLADAARQLTLQRERSSGVSAKPFVSAVCRYLGVWPPASFRSAHTVANHQVGDRHLARIRQMLAQHPMTVRQTS
ncbi:hypothetical protein QYH69_35495 [Paraburkholderia sp. SARCC-3016]|uniref:hypothetical protein n=1 Tax=Paraburkholderia sp. SARCC-3016 TaxID=3058611 RepID=UPI0028070E13|nr:hypothetical protein [Paraburkholderia sp. SARCC-3016]MDQ7982514.1 hypothetical protein [Paraburkholderia sp. SARCC-3016]